MWKEVLKEFKVHVAGGLVGLVVSVITFIFSNNLFYGLLVLTLFLLFILSYSILRIWKERKKARIREEEIEREHYRSPFFLELEVITRQISGDAPPFDVITRQIQFVKNRSSKYPIRIGGRNITVVLATSSIPSITASKITLEEAKKYAMKISKEIEVTLKRLPLVEEKDEKGIAWHKHEYWVELKEPLQGGEYTAFSYNFRSEKVFSLEDYCFKTIHNPTAKLVYVLVAPPGYEIKSKGYTTLNQIGNQEASEMKRLKDSDFVPKEQGTTIRWEICDPIISFSYYLYFELKKI